MTTTTMVDCISTDVPAVLGAPKLAGLPAAGYVTGGPPVEWSESQFDLFARKIRICQQPADNHMAADARVIDVERGAARPSDVPGFLALRAMVAGNATVYCSLAAVPAVLEVITAAYHCDMAEAAQKVPRWWLAWWWQRPGQPSADQVLAELAGMFRGLQLPKARLWACQYADYAQWDLSCVYGPADFSRR